MSEFTEFCKSIDLDKLADPKFTVTLDGIAYTSILSSLDGFQKMADEDARLAKDKIEADSVEGLIRRALVIFPGITRDQLEKLNLAKLAALIRGAVEHAHECMRMSIADLENFSRGKAQEKN